MVRPPAVWRSKGENLKEQVQEWLQKWFAGRGKMGQGSQPNLLVDYFAAGWLTSMEIVEFVTEIEQQFRMQFSEADLQDARFVTISGLSELILERSAQPVQSR